MSGLLDFPTAWAILRTTVLDHHHEDCSYRTTGGALMCDCAAMTAAARAFALAGADAAASVPELAAAGLLVDLLATVKADAWDEGYRAGIWAPLPIDPAGRNPYRADPTEGGAA